MENKPTPIRLYVQAVYNSEACPNPTKRIFLFKDDLLTFFNEVALNIFSREVKGETFDEKKKIVSTLNGMRNAIRLLK